MNKRVFLTTVCVFALTGATGVFSASAGWSWRQSKDLIYTGIVDGVAVGGYDPVAYFTEEKPVEGDPAITLNHDGVEWRFASLENRALFEADPDRYAPQYGGHCAWAIASGQRYKGDPKNWDIIDGKLYLNFNDDIQKRWQADPQSFIDEAEGKWISILRADPS